MDDFSPILKEATKMAHIVFKKYRGDKTDFSNYRCDILLLKIAVSENIILESHPFSADLCGFLIIDEDEKTIVYNSNHDSKNKVKRRNFTIGHELGHYFLHRNKKLQFVDRAKDLLDTTNSNYEIQANAFSAYLILPIEVLEFFLRERLSFHKISDTVGISKQSLHWRLINHLKTKYDMNQQYAEYIIEEFEQFSVATSKNMGNHQLALLYHINKNNYKDLIEKRKSGKTISILYDDFGSISRIDMKVSLNNLF